MRRREQQPRPAPAGQSVAGYQHHDLAGQRQSHDQEYRLLRRIPRMGGLQPLGRQPAHSAGLPGCRVPRHQDDHAERRAQGADDGAVDLHRGAAVPGADRRWQVQLAGRCLPGNQQAAVLEQPAGRDLHQLHRRQAQPLHPDEYRLDLGCQFQGLLQQQGALCPGDLQAHRAAQPDGRLPLHHGQADG